MPYKDIELRREKNRRWRAANPGYYAAYRLRDPEGYDARIRESKRRHPLQESAREFVRKRVNTQRLWPVASFFKCSDCDQQAQEYHHEDYDLPWSVEPLCHKCHGIRHRAS